MAYWLIAVGIFVLTAILGRRLYNGSYDMGILLAMFVTFLYLTLTAFIGFSVAGNKDIANEKESVDKLIAEIENTYDISIESVDRGHLRTAVKTHEEGLLQADPTRIAYSYGETIYRTDIYLQVVESEDGGLSLVLLTDGSTAELEPFNPEDIEALELFNS